MILLAAMGSQCSGDRTHARVGERAPAFSLESLGGERSELERLTRNGIVVLNFWASWCAPCKAEVPMLNKIHREYRDKGLTLVGISVQERSDMVAAFSRRHRVEYRVLLDSDGRVAKQYGLLALPLTIVIDAEGKVRYRENRMIDAETEKGLKSMIDELRSRS